MDMFVNLAVDTIHTDLYDIHVDNYVFDNSTIDYTAKNPINARSLNLMSYLTTLENQFITIS